ncbi:trichohyalin-like [Macrobrachium rosenbergii]|uniref:trichohyalin-like n=1 Tax=Macrobrachium rosenbergii TaxID=79674 RepID=UPI0034D4566C
MFAFQVFAWNVFVLVLIVCEIYLSIEEDLLNLLRARAITGRLQETLHHAVVAESCSPEVVETRPHSGGIDTSAFAGAVPWMVLMAGALALPFAVYWTFTLIGCDDLDCEEDDLEVPALDVTLETEDFETSDEQKEEEEEEQQIFETEILDSSDDEEEEELEDINQEPQLPRQHPQQLDKEKQASAKELEICQVHGGPQLERLLDEANKEIAWLQKQILDKDLLLEQKAAEGTELTREIEHLNTEKEQVQAEKRKLQDDYELVLSRDDALETLQKQLTDNIASLENQLQEKDHLLRKRDDEERKLRSVFQQMMVQKDRELEVASDKANKLDLRLKEIEANNQALASERDCFKRANEEKEREVNHQQELLVRRAIEAEKDQLHLGVLENQILDMKEDNMALQRQLESELDVMRNWVSELGGENTLIKQDLRDRCLDITLLKKQLGDEQEKAHILKEEVQAMKNWVTDLGAENITLKEVLERAEGEICSLKKAESINLRELEQLRKECERLREKCTIQEENIIKERKRAREHLRTQEEELRNQDKYMLMTLLHGTAQRNFHLEHIALDCRNKSLDNNREEEDPDKTSEEKDLLDQVQKLEEEQHRMYRNAQQEKDDYGKQWAVLTQMVEDLIQGDERKNS